MSNFNPLPGPIGNEAREPTPLELSPEDDVSFTPEKAWKNRTGVSEQQSASLDPIEDASKLCKSKQRKGWGNDVYESALIQPFAQPVDTTIRPTVSDKPHASPPFRGGLDTDDGPRASDELSMNCRIAWRMTHETEASLDNAIWHRV